MLGPIAKGTAYYDGPKVQSFVSAPISFVSAPISFDSAPISFVSALLIFGGAERKEMGGAETTNWGCRDKILYFGATVRVQLLTVRQGVVDVDGGGAGVT